MIRNILLIFLVAKTLILSQDFSGIRIYINPGHGGHDSDDRYIPETGFWESEGNLTKGLYLKEILDSYNATTKISRTTNNSSDDLALSVISADANNFDADYFHSIHSNAFNGESNYTLLLYKEVNDQPVFADAKRMSDIMVDKIYQSHRTTNKYVHGDLSFLGFNLGVLRNLTMPGTLSEGSFHDYIPESWRLRNDAYLKTEAWAIAKSFIEYFSLGQFSFGEIQGILRDPFETINYYSIGSDNKKPLNLVKVTLLPDNKIFFGDDLNNGFYLFDELAPGNYDLILEAEDYKADTIYNVTVAANQITFIDKYLTEKPNYNPPVITSYSPVETQNVRLNSQVIINFSIKMDRSSVEQAFSISPWVIGTYKWENNDKRMIYTPNDFLQGGTQYTISINSFAQSAYGIFIDSTFSYSFTTRSSLSLVDSYPRQDENNVSTTVKFIFSFDAPINEYSLGGKILFQDMNDEDVTIKIDDVDYQGGKIMFEPANPLTTNTQYKVILKSGIEDTEGSNLGRDTTIYFITEHSLVVNGNVLEDFNTLDNWWQPGESGSTTGINQVNTSFNVSAKRRISESYSAYLKYEFSNDSGGLCRLYNSTEPIIASGEFGMWVFGDNSNNLLEYWFRDNNGNNQIFFVDSLNWTGWKFKKIDLSNYSVSSFHSIVINQSIIGNSNGQLYFEDITSNVITNIIARTEEKPDNFYLYQNYPNPFNPSTLINFALPQKQYVDLVIYNMLGEVVEHLIHEELEAGYHEIEFNAKSISTGIYFYKLSAGKFVETKKMLLLK